MKLELNHLAPYLPYGLKCLTYIHQIKYGERTQLLVNGMSIDTDGKLNIEFLYEDDLKFSNSMRKVMPILKPINDIYSDKNIAFHFSKKRFSLILGWIKQGIEIRDHLFYSEIVALCEYHYDFQRLIPQNLAIDINTLES